MAKYQITEEDRNYIRRHLPRDWASERGGEVEVYYFETYYPKHEISRNVSIYCYLKSGMYEIVGCGGYVSRKKFEDLPLNKHIPFKDIDFYG